MYPKGGHLHELGQKNIFSIFHFFWDFFCFFKEMAVAHSIFTSGREVQLFWTAVDPMFTMVPLEVALGWHKFYFWAFQKNNYDVTLGNHLPDYFLKCPKIKFVPS